MSAAVGSEVTLQCEVEYQSGHVQWTKDGYALGKNEIKISYRKIIRRTREEALVFRVFG